MEHAPPDAPAWLVSLQESALGQEMRQSLLLYPIVEIIHLIGIALLVGSIVALDLRLLGFRRFLPATGMAQHLLPVSIVGFLMAVASGAMLFTTEAASLAFNPSFQLKLALIVLGGINAAAFHLGPWRAVARWESTAPPAAARIGGALSIVLWLGVLTCGRMIAYL